MPHDLVMSLGSGVMCLLCEFVSHHKKARCSGEELNLYISDLSRIGKNYRDTHTELSSGLTVQVHKTQYPDSSDDRKKVSDSVK